MEIVYIPGVWDLLHVGHVTVLERAKALGDVLIVGVPDDWVVLQDKKEPPIICLEHRMRMLQALQCVDIAIPYHQLEFKTHLDMIKPDILAVGGTWGQEARHLHAEHWVIANSKRLVRLPYSVETSTSNIINRVRERFGV